MDVLMYTKDARPHHRLQRVLWYEREEVLVATVALIHLHFQTMAMAVVTQQAKAVRRFLKGKTRHLLVINRPNILVVCAMGKEE